jgi:hypothetical protein
MESLTLSNKPGNNDAPNDKLSNPPGKPYTPISSLPLPFTAALSNKAFTPHHAVWRALTSLFTTLLSHIRLPADIADEICYCLGSWISFFDPEYYFTSGWSDLSHAPESRPEQAATGNERVAQSENEVDNAIRSMDAWNSDLTWFIFENGRRAKTTATPSELATVVVRMDLRLRELRGSFRLGSPAREENFAGGDKSERWKFAEVVF